MCSKNVRRVFRICNFTDSAEPPLLMAQASVGEPLLASVWEPLLASVEVTDDAPLSTVPHGPGPADGRVGVAGPGEVML